MLTCGMITPLCLSIPVWFGEKAVAVAVLETLTPILLKRVGAKRAVMPTTLLGQTPHAIRNRPLVGSPQLIPMTVPLLTTLFAVSAIPKPWSESLYTLRCPGPLSLQLPLPGVC